MPTDGNPHDPLWPAARLSLHELPATSTSWPTLSAFVQVTESPLWTVTLAGLNPVLVICTAPDPARAVGPIARTASATAASSTFLIVKTPFFVGFNYYRRCPPAESS